VSTEFQIFISSTVDDLKGIRKKLAAALEQPSCIVRRLRQMLPLMLACRNSPARAVSPRLPTLVGGDTDPGIVPHFKSH